MRGQGMSGTYEHDGDRYTEVNIHQVTGLMDNYAVMERGKPQTAMVLYGWDEVGLFDHQFTSPVYVRITEAQA